MRHPLDRSTPVVFALLLGLSLTWSASPASAQLDSGERWADLDLELVPGEGTESELRRITVQFEEDRDALGRRWDVPFSPERRARLQEFYGEWEEALDDLDYGSLRVEGRIDWHLLKNEIRYQQALLERQGLQREEMRPVLPFLETVAEKVEAWRNFEQEEPRAAAEWLVALADEVEATHEEVRSAMDAGNPPVRRTVGLRAVNTLRGLSSLLEEWYGFYAGYDPLFTWWAAEPWGRVETALREYRVFLSDELVGLDQEGLVIGDPIGAEGLADDLEHEMIVYTPAELVEIAEAEFAWIENEMRRAARDMGHGEDVDAALEEVKNRAVPPGEQPELIEMLAREAVDFLEERDLLTIPPLAREVWRWEMMSPERQRVAPFFLGGEVIRISYPTDEMTHAEKLMSMRGNNPHFSRATVHHELIPGHHLQGFMTDRYSVHRDPFSTPFWGEGWALYWEMRLWDLDFPSTPEDRMGMLFWRAHRAARIIFSLSFHLGTMTPEEAVDFLVERVGHERANAEAEVRRSFLGNYPPLYQAAYMLGGLQIRALHESLVQSGEMEEKAFHDAILRGGRMPIEMVKARLEGTLLPRDWEPEWRFYGEPGN